MDSVIEFDFGRERRDAGRLLTKLLGILEAQEAELLSDPVRLYRMAGKEIARLHVVLQTARDALRVPVAYGSFDVCSRPSIETHVVVKDEWLRLQACAAIVKQWEAA
jgi:hypothetical protein